MNNGVLVQNNYRELPVNSSLPLNGIGKNSNTPSINGPNVGSYDPNNLVFIIDTSKEPANSRVSIPLGGTVNCTIFWGDGTSETHTTTGFKTHTYEKPGIYTVQIQGTMTSLSFGGGANTTDNKLKIVKVLSFGNFGITGSFRGLQELSNLIECPSRLPSTITDFRIFFRGCSSFNDPNITQWDTSKIIFTAEMFMGATSFNQNLNAWNTSSMTALNSMFNSASSFNQPVGSWNISSVTDISNIFAAAINFNQDLSNWNTSNVTNMQSVFLSASAFNQNLSSWNTSNVTSMSRMFDSATSFNNAGNSGINNWNTSKVTNMTRMFFQTPFNQPIGNWDVSKVTDMNTMFYLNYVFNQDIGNWNVSGVTNIGSMFGNALGFNNGNSSGINNWNTINVTTMSSAFLNASSFNQPLNNWNVRKVTSFASMFQGATSFNSSLSGWALGVDTAGTSCASMFMDAPSFNQDIGNWDVSKVTNMNQMFTRNSVIVSGFNNGGSSSISGWNTSNVTNMFGMFANISGFNQPIGSWNVSKVQTMGSMFQNAYAFNQDLSNWNLAGLSANTALDGFLLNKTGANALSTANYDTLLIGWNNNKASGVNGVANWRTDLRPNFGGAKYTGGGAAATARAALVSYGWTITDGGVA